jgi:proline iminopeptidase
MAAFEGRAAAQMPPRPEEDPMIRSPFALALVAVVGLAAACSSPAPETTAPAETTKTKSAAPSAQLENGSFEAELNGFSIHYEVHGDGPVVMTLPNSWGLTLGGLRALYQPLEERLTMVYFDPRGMGGSAPIREDSDMSMAAVRTDFDALRQHLGLAKVHAIGWSNGATNMILLAAEHSDSLASATFLHGAASFSAEEGEGFGKRFPELFAKYGAFQKAVADEALSVEAQTAMQRAFWLGEYFPLLFADPEAGEAKIQQMYEGVDLSWPHAAYAQQELPTFDFGDKLPTITARCLVVAGAKDMITPEKVGELHEGIADSQFVVFENSGHFAPVEELDEFKTTLYGFLGVS